MVGNSVHAYLREVKLEAAARLLLDGGSVTQAALSVGFESLSHFSKIFTAAKGVRQVAMSDSFDEVTASLCERMLSLAKRVVTRIEKLMFALPIANIIAQTGPQPKEIARVTATPDSEPRDWLPTFEQKEVAHFRAAGIA